MHDQAFDNKLKIGKEGSAWASRGEGGGAWILATFSRPVKIVKLKVGLLNPQRSKVSVRMIPGQILQRHNPVESNKQISLDTSSGWSQTANLPSKVNIFVEKISVSEFQVDHHWNVISLSKPVTTSWLKITVKLLYGTVNNVNNGFKEIQIFGC